VSVGETLARSSRNQTAAIAGSKSDKGRTDDMPQKGSRSSKVIEPFELFRGQRSTKKSVEHESHESDE
jgi:hypothetical protein